MADFHQLARYGKILGDNVVTLFWGPDSTKTPASPIFCLGQVYDTRSISPFHDLSQTSVPSPSDMSQTKSNEPPSEVLEEISKSEIKEMINNDSQTSSNDPNKEESDAPPEFLNDLESRISFTYRSNFPPIPRQQDASLLDNMLFTFKKFEGHATEEGLTTDDGWGCMIRTGQSLLANTLQISELGRGKQAFWFPVKLNIYRLEARNTRRTRTKHNILICR
jgi:cysteine protease ATG4